MGKRKSLFTYVKRLFISESKPKSQRKWKNSRLLSKMFKFKNYPAIEAPDRLTLSDAAEDQQKRAIAVATAAAAAAEAAVAAANAAAEVARLTNSSRELLRKKHLHAAAVKIQTCYRGYLARKALSALKGVVRLQAVVRGDLARQNLHRQRSTIIHKIQIPNSNSTTLGSTKLVQLKLRTAIKQAKTEAALNLTSPFTQRRRSFCHAKEKSTRDDPSPHNARIFRAFMATTESAKAKARSSSTPKQRPRLSESHSCQDSPSKLSISSWSSFNSEQIFKPSKR